jgi:hypothetical protein
MVDKKWIKRLRSCITLPADILYNASAYVNSICADCSICCDWLQEAAIYRLVARFPSNCYMYVHYCVGIAFQLNEIHFRLQLRCKAGVLCGWNETNFTWYFMLAAIEPFPKTSGWT